MSGGVGDGEQVRNSCTCAWEMREGGTRQEAPATRMDRGGCYVGGRDPGKSGSPNSSPTLTGDAAEASEGAWCPGRQEKPLAVPARGHALHRPYRTPTLVGRGKDPKVDERSSVKELGKLAP